MARSSCCLSGPTKRSPLSELRRRGGGKNSMSNVSSGRPPKGDATLTDMVEDALRSGCRTSHQVAEFTKIPYRRGVTATLRRLEKRGIAVMVKTINYEGS